MIVVNPSILAHAGIPFSAGVTATVLVSFIGSCAMGLYARSPILVAPGMGINALFAYTMVVGAKVPLEVALGCVFWAGVLFTVMAFFNLRQTIIEAIPVDLRYGIACGIGLFIALIGLENAKFIVANPDTIVGLTQFNPVTLTFIAGFILTVALVVRRIPGAMMAGMILTTILAVPIGRWWGDGSAFSPETPDVHTLVNWSGFSAAPDFSFVGQIDLIGALNLIYLPFIFVFLFTNFIEALSTFLGLAEAADLKDETGMPRNIRESMHVDAIAALISAPLGTSPATVYLESGAGIQQGAGRVSSRWLRVFFVPFLFLSPLLSLVPAVATAPVLILTGLFMSEPISNIRWSALDEAIPAFLAIVLIPLTFSITLGLSLAIIAYVLIKLVCGRAGDVRPVMWFVALLAAALVAQTQ